MSLSIDKKEVASGESSAILGDPVKSLMFLSKMLSDQGLKLAPGDLVLAGASTAAVPFQANQRVEAEVSGLGCVSLRS